MGRRSAQTPKYPGWVWAALAAVVVVAAAALIAVTGIFPQLQSAVQPDPPGQQETPTQPPLEQDQPATASGAAPCIALPVLASLENADMVKALASAYSAKLRDVDGKCVTVTVTQEKSGVAAGKVAAGFASTPATERPAVWLPDSSAWLAVAGEQSPNSLVSGKGQSVAASGIVLAMPRSMAEAIGWDKEAPSWSEVFAAAADPGVWQRLGHEDWGTFKFGKASPTVSTSGLMALLTSYGVAGGDVKDIERQAVTEGPVIEKVRAAELSTSHYMATPEHFLWHARQADDTGKVHDFLSAVIVDEKSVWDYNKGISSNDGVNKQAGPAPKEPLLAVYPSDGVFVADNPGVVLSGDWVSTGQRLAAEDFLKFAATEQGQATVTSAGYRSIRGAVDPQVAATGHYAESLQELPLPAVDVLAAVQESFPDVRKRARALFLLDVSGSMEDEIAPGVTRLQGAKDAVTKALEHFTGDDQVGLAAFSQRGEGPLEPGLVSPVAPFAGNKADILAKLNALQPIAATPLFEAVGTFAAQQAAEYKADSINTIILLSDGRNESSHPADLASVTTLLGSQHHTTPVLVFTLAYGSEADTSTLRAIAKASGAHFYDATDPGRLEAVLGDLVTSF
ncbi:substrate-binding domain-containing protein [Pseudarthrobacter sp. J75]|uniref:vWA domain-containing protein n=1 Tax=unclassified Pseudarthrobacter TaxID=2647000 RepID=UPI002E81E58B|nr:MULTISPECIES: substrate-binding domain-containing protein [unclassified Pseudarthrobacter]MEE2523944.1 substrate-binding domain-containing protein [Pseudarthrobacter sp. J47]MEE2528288.1 substrate-binding domain-containing protein [Pseudarthrobacter sp. J75]MEE2567990.1 substrate-binding domain-containing protein [Pseudarthrobacter sp. J64]